MPVYETDIGTIEAMHWGAGDERIILLHCARSGPGSLATLATNLCSPGRMLIAPALNAYGQTRVSGTDAIEEHLSVVTWVVNHSAREVMSVTLFGHSMGGLIALLAAGAQPQCQQVIAYDPIAPGVLDLADSNDRDAFAWDRDIVIELHDAVTKGEDERGVARFIEAWNGTPWKHLPQRCAAN